MLFFDGGLGLILFALWLYCIIDVITTPDTACRNLPKLVWLLIVIVLPDVGSIAWLVAGHNWTGPRETMAYRGDPARPRAVGRPAKARSTNPDDDDEFLASLRARAEEQRRRARESEPRDEPPGTTPPAH